MASDAGRKDWSRRGGIFGKNYHVQAGLVTPKRYKVLMAAEEAKRGSDALPIAAAGKARTAEEVFAKCDCCGLTEEYTEAYITLVREKNAGRWICGLCSEAVKEEISRSDEDIGSIEALDRHMKFCQKFRSSNPAEELISAMKQLLRRTLDSPKKREGHRVKKRHAYIRWKRSLSTETN